jgi:superfamily II DNA or RNA helicase
MKWYFSNLNVRQYTKQQLQHFKQIEKMWKEQLNNVALIDLNHTNKIQTYDKLVSEKTRLRFGNKLFEYQRTHTKKLMIAIKRYRRVLDASDTGTGKTYCSTAVCMELGLFPIVCCPKAAISTWERVFKEFGVKKYYIRNYEQYRNGNTPYLNKPVKIDKPPFEQSDEYNECDPMIYNNRVLYNERMSELPEHECVWTIPKNSIVIFDECHKVKNRKTYNFSMYYAIIKQNLRCMSLSATVADKVKYAYPIALNLGLVKSYTQYRRTYNGSLQLSVENVGWEVHDGTWLYNEEYDDIVNEEKCENASQKLLYKQIYPLHGSRLKISELGDAFPENKIDANTYNMESKAKEIQKVYEEMNTKILLIKINEAKKRQEELTKLMGIAHKTDDEKKKYQHLANTNYDQTYIQKLQTKLNAYTTNGITQEHLGKTPLLQDETNILTIIMRARQRVELLKCDTIIELAKQFEEEGNNVVIFVNFNETLDYIISHIGKCAVVRGGQKIEERDDNIQQFQKEEVHFIVCNIQSGGVAISLHDLKGNRPRRSIISPCWSAQDLMQTFGRIYRAGGKTKCIQYIVYCANTIEDDMCSNVREKIDTIHTLNDGDVRQGFEV